jgi:hypothetical protein
MRKAAAQKSRPLASPLQPAESGERSRVRSTRPIITQFPSLDACLTYARSRFTYVPEAQQWNRLKISDAIFHTAEWERTEGTLPRKEEMDARALLLQQALSFGSHELLPGVVFPFRVMREDVAQPEPVTWEWFRYIVAQPLPPMVVVMPLPALRHVKDPTSDLERDQLHDFWTRAAALLLAQKLGCGGWNPEDIELVEFNEEPIGLSFDGKVVRPEPLERVVCRV